MYIPVWIYKYDDDDHHFDYDYDDIPKKNRIFLSSCSQIRLSFGRKKIFHHN